MVLCLSKTIGRTPDSWLSMQGNSDLLHAKQQINLTVGHEFVIIAKHYFPLSRALYGSGADG